MATLDHTAKLGFCHSLASTLAGILAERMYMVLAWCLIVSITFGAGAPRLSKARSVNVKSRVSASAVSAMPSAVRTVRSKTRRLSCSARRVAPPMQAAE